MSLMSSLPPVEKGNRPEIIYENPLTSLSTDHNAPNPFAREILFVATNLDSWEADDIRFGHEVMLDVCYRQLDASYYAWLRDKMTGIKQAHDSGRMKVNIFEELRTRFNAVHTWAVRHIGESALCNAIATTDLKSYTPPSEGTYTAYRKICDDAWNARQLSSDQPPTISDPATRLACLLSTRGYAAIRSAVIDNIVVIVRDDSVVVPDKHATKVWFTIDEINLLTDTSPETIKRICEIKVKFGGTIVPADDCPFKDDGPGNERTAIQQSLFMAEAGTCT